MLRFHEDATKNVTYNFNFKICGCDGLVLFFHFQYFLLFYEMMD